MADPRYLLAYRISTGDVIPDFQTKATPAVLFDNAVAQGIPREDIEIRQVSQTEWQTLQDAAFAAEKAQAAADLAQLKLDATALMAKLGINKAEVRTLAAMVGFLLDQED